VTNKTFHISVPEADEEIAADRLWQLGVEAVGIGSASDGRVELWTAVGAGEAAIERAIACLSPGWTWRTADIVTPEETWRNHVEPTWYADDGVVVPSWLGDRSLVGPATVVTRIEPASSFGLGDHPTTRLTLGVIAAHLRELSGQSGVAGVSNLLDVGCGSGVLGIMAAQRGVPVIRAVDISAGAIEATNANAHLNGVADRIDADMATLGEVAESYDVIAANILAPVLITMAADLRRLLAPGGVLVVSGILADNHDHVVDALRPLHVERSIVDDGWACLVLRA
jgi:ribosomal protein L11 methyltransferase